MENMENMENYGYWPHDQDHPSSFMVPPPPWLNSGEAVEEEDRAAAASRSHSEAEKRRRDRINAQLSTLRKFIPKSDKMDKAALLGQVVNHVKEQSMKAKEVSTISTIPTEIDEVTLDYYSKGETAQNDANDVYMKASLCCEDRPELFSELNSALKGLGITIVEAEITSLGGRMRTNLVICAKGITNDQKGAIRQSLKLALSRVVISSGATFYSARSKRQRFFYPNYN